MGATIQVLDCNNPKVCLDYHMLSRSVCCNAKYEQRKFRNGRDCTDTEYARLIADWNKADTDNAVIKANRAIGQVQFRFVCMSCGEKCETVTKHRGSL